MTDSPDVTAEAVAPTYTLEQHPEALAVVRLGPGSEIPGWAGAASLFSITATATETSLVCAAHDVPPRAKARQPLTAFAVQGPLDPALTGVLVALLVPLAAEEIGVFTISTFDTDWILVGRDDAERAAESWRREGHTVTPAPLPAPTRTGKQGS